MGQHSRARADSLDRLRPPGYPCLSSQHFRAPTGSRLRGFVQAAPRGKPGPDPRVGALHHGHGLGPLFQVLRLLMAALHLPPLQLVPGHLHTPLCLDHACRILAHFVILQVDALLAQAQCLLHPENHAPPALDLDSREVLFLRSLLCGFQQRRGVLLSHRKPPPDALHRYSCGVLLGGFTRAGRGLQRPAVRSALLRAMPGALDGVCCVLLNQLPLHTVLEVEAVPQLLLGHVSAPVRLDQQRSSVPLLQLLGLRIGHRHLRRNGVQLTLCGQGLAALVAPPRTLNGHRRPLPNRCKILLLGRLLSLQLHALPASVFLRHLLGDMHLPHAADVALSFRMSHGRQSVLILVLADLDQGLGVLAALCGLERERRGLALGLQHRQDLPVPDCAAPRQLLHGPVPPPRALNAQRRIVQAVLGPLGVAFGGLRRQRGAVVCGPGAADGCLQLQHRRAHPAHALAVAHAAGHGLQQQHRPLLLLRPNLVLQSEHRRSLADQEPASLGLDLRRRLITPLLQNVLGVADVLRLLELPQLPPHDLDAAAGQHPAEHTLDVAGRDILQPLFVGPVFRHRRVNNGAKLCPERLERGRILRPPRLEPLPMPLLRSPCDAKSGEGPKPPLQRLCGIAAPLRRRFGGREVTCVAVKHKAQSHALLLCRLRGRCTCNGSPPRPLDGMHCTQCAMDLDSGPVGSPRALKCQCHQRHAVADVRAGQALLPRMPQPQPHLSAPVPPINSLDHRHGPQPPPLQPQLPHLPLCAPAPEHRLQLQCGRELGGLVEVRCEVCNPPLPCEAYTGACGSPAPRRSDARGTLLLMLQDSQGRSTAAHEPAPGLLDLDRVHVVQGLQLRLPLVDLALALLPELPADAEAAPSALDSRGLLYHGLVQLLLEGCPNLHFVGNVTQSLLLHAENTLLRHLLFGNQHAAVSLDSRGGVRQRLLVHVIPPLLLLLRPVRFGRHAGGAAAPSPLQNSR
mmetsp:Transcript_3014/g.5766  ORF Transcript_3014/g.5766 Transcript_3014/m.5766 type:complete len:966 (-) Transcript_3014:1404-4301(-)